MQKTLTKPHRLTLFNIPGTFWCDRFDVNGKMFQIEEANVGIAIAMARLDDEDMGHFSSQKTVEIKRTGYNKALKAKDQTIENE